ncbi:hypothetical protein [Streptomyces nigrescens]|uniref:hypothetical protein n=1 Tax=Streptomyces nigrescens TaxID=1920 RepID=UPI0036F4BB83
MTAISGTDTPCEALATVNAAEQQSARRSSMKTYRYEIHTPGPEGTEVAERGTKEHGDAHGLGRLVLGLWQLNAPEAAADAPAIVKVWGDHGVFVELDDPKAPDDMTRLLEYALEEKMIADYKLREQMRVVHHDGQPAAQIIHRVRHAMPSAEAKAVLEASGDPNTAPAPA